MRRSTPEEKREQTRQRVARWRAKNCIELAVRGELACASGEGRGKRPGFRAVELVRDGLPVWLGIVAVDAAPPSICGAVESRDWLPHWPVSRRAALALIALRRQQIASWIGRPECVKADGHIDWGEASDREGATSGGPAGGGGLGL
jgi:hypothetical protein